MNDNRLSLDDVNAMTPSAFAARFAGIYECSPWVAEGAAARRPFASLTAMRAAMAGVVAAAGEERQLALLRAHPDLAGQLALAGDLTAESAKEQGAAGLSRLSADELARFTAANEAYRRRFGFPFVLAVKHWTKSHILAAFDPRLDRSRDVEREAALAEVDKIAFSRLLDLVEPSACGRLTTHVLDTVRGRPAAGMGVVLSRLESGGAPTVLKSAVTNADGRLDAPVLGPGEMAAGRYELTFAVGRYFLGQGVPLAAPAFLDEVPIRFSIANPEDHHHVPLLVSPWSYSTYRGS